MSELTWWVVKTCSHVWSVLAVMDDCVAEPWCDMLAHHLGLDEPNEPDVAPGIPVIGSAPV